MTTLSRCRDVDCLRCQSRPAEEAGEAVDKKAESWAICVSRRTLKDDGQRTRGERVEMIAVSNAKGNHRSRSI